MALGKRKDGGNFLPIIKFDARVGTFYLQDRVNSGGAWQTEQRDVTETFQAAFDLENLQRGWIRLAKGAAPEVKLVLAGDDPGEPPTDDHKEGIRVVPDGRSPRRRCSRADVDGARTMERDRHAARPVSCLRCRTRRPGSCHHARRCARSKDGRRRHLRTDLQDRRLDFASARAGRSSPGEARGTLAMPLSQPSQESDRQAGAGSANADMEDEIPF